MKKTRELKGMLVLTLQEGERLGQVRDLILDPATRHVVALVLDRRVGGEDQVVATANVCSVGGAAITVEDRSSLVPLGRIPRFQELARTRKPIQGKLVITEAGTRLGHVDDLEVDIQTFRLVSLVLKGLLGRGRVIPADLVRTIGADAIVVREEALAVVAAPPAGPELPPVEEPVPPTPPPSTAGPLPETPALPPEPAAAPPPPSTEPVPPAAETPPPEPAPPAAEGAPPEPGPPPAEEAPAGEGENAWQRWVRRLKNG